MIKKVGIWVVIRVINWNISYQGKTSSKIELLQTITSEVAEGQSCLVALQEVTENAYMKIADVGLFSNHVYSLNYRKPGDYESRNRRLGCLVGVAGEIDIEGASLLDRALFPERALCAKISSYAKEFEVISFHSLTGVDFKKGKAANFAVLADYLHNRKGKPQILCCDLNEPKIDHLELTNIECYDQKGDKGKYAGYILKPNENHDLQDAFRLWLMDNPDEYQRVKEIQSECENLDAVPLAVSFALRGGKNKRYDYIMVSPHFKVSNITYRHEDALRHGSDHAIVVADLE